MKYWLCDDSLLCVIESEGVYIATGRVSELSHIMQGLGDGEHPRTLFESSDNFQYIHTKQLRSIAIESGRNLVEFVVQSGNGAVFLAESNDIAINIGTGIADALGLVCRTREQTLLESSFIPAIVMGIVVVVSVIMSLAVTPDSSMASNAIKNQQEFQNAFNTLGPAGVYSISALVVAAATGYWFYKALNRGTLFLFENQIA